MFKKICYIFKIFILLSPNDECLETLWHSLSTNWYVQLVEKVNTSCLTHISKPHIMNDQKHEWKNIVCNIEFHG